MKKNKEDDFKTNEEIAPKPTNKKFKQLNGWLIELEESSMKLKVTHKSNQFQFRVGAGIESDMVFSQWSDDKNSENVANVMNSIKVLVENGLTDIELLLKLNQCFLDHLESKLKKYSEKDHEDALGEVKRNLSEKEKLLADEVMSDIKIEKLN